MKNASQKRRGYSGYEPLHTNPNFRIKYPEITAYNLGGTPVHTSPCMDSYWRSQPIRQGKVRDEWDFELKPDEE